MLRRISRRTPSSFWAGVAAGLLLSLISFLAWWYVPATPGAADPPTAEAAAPPSDGITAPVHVLLLGVDERPSVMGSRTDTMLLVRFAPGEVRMLSIPRDTKVELEEHPEGKINAAYTYGGVSLAKEAVGRVVGVPVDYYVKVNLAAFRKVVDMLGGVKINVPKPMHYVDPTDDLEIDLEPGLQVLNGQKAEQYVRFRHDEIGDDMGRVHRQQEFLKATVAQALTPANLVKLPRLLLTLREHVETDVPVTQQVKLAHAAFAAQQRGAVLQETLPGRGADVDEISYFLVDEEQLQNLLDAWGGAASGR